MAYVLFDSWAGRTKARVTILKRCAKRTQVRFEEKAFWRQVGHVQFVPNTAIKKDEWDAITYPELSLAENDEIRVARRAGFASMYPAYPNAEAQARSTLDGARKFMATAHSYYREDQ